MKIALTSMKVNESVEENLNTIISMMEETKKEGAELIVFPETSMYRTSDRTKLKDIAESIDGNFVTSVRNKSKELKIDCVIGMHERGATKGSKPKNSVLYIDDKGTILSHYSKTHLYDAFVAMESEWVEPSNNPIRGFETRFGRMGLMVCYELRFPEIARTLTLDGAKVLLVPTAWVKGNLKEEHFSLLCRARALENTVFLLAPNQCQHASTGGSMLVDPMGVIRYKLGHKTEYVITHIDINYVDEVRNILPAINQRHTNLYKLD